MTAETIDHATLVKLIDAGAVRAAHVIGRAGGWGVMVACGKAVRPLAAQRGRARLFSKLETVVTYLKGIGLNQFDVDAIDYNPNYTRRARPDRAEALKRAHEAAAYDKWFRAQVQSSLDDPRPSIPNEEATKHWARKRAQLLKKTKARRGG